MVVKRTFDTADGDLAEADLADAQRLLAEALVGRSLHEVPDASFPAGAPGAALAALGAAAIAAAAEAEGHQVYVDGTCRIAHVVRRPGDDRERAHGPRDSSSWW